MKFIVKLPLSEFALHFLLSIFLLSPVLGPVLRFATHNEKNAT